MMVRLVFRLLILCLACCWSLAQADIVYRAAASGGVSSGSLSISKPVGTASGDVLIASIAVRPSGASINTPSGWTRLRNTAQSNDVTMNLATFHRVAGASEPASYTWTFSTGHSGATGGILAFTGVNTADPIDVEGGNTTASGYTHRANQITTTVADTMLVSAHAFTSAPSNWTAPSGMTEAVDAASRSRPDTGGISLEMNYQTRSSVGATGNKDAVAASSGSDAGYGAAHLLALAPELAPPAPVAEWRMDELGWSGVAGEVVDSSGNGHHGQARNGAGTTSGKLCHAGSFDGGNDYVTVSGLSALLNGTASLAFWIKTTQSGNDTDWQAPGVTGVELDGGTDDIFWGWLDASGHIGVSVGDDSSSKSVTAIRDGGWRHVALTRDAGSGAYRIYIDGSLNKSGTLATGSVGTAYASLGRIEDTGGSPVYLNGQLDEVLVFDRVLSDSQVLAGYTNQNTGKNWDGSARTCAVPATGPAALNAVDPGAHAITGQITTKTAGTGFSLDVYALNAGRTAQDSAATGDVLLDLVANNATGVALDANNCPVSGTALGVGTVTLAAGQASAAVPAVANVWRDVRVRMRYPAAGPYTVTACSADNFAVKPASLAAVASHADWQSAGITATLANTGASGGAIHKAGRPFTLRLTGYTAGGAVTSQYDGSPAASLTCVLPASGCTPGSLSSGGFSASAGTVTSSSASYSEVGAISASFADTGYASVDSDDTAASCAGFHACASAISIGRFVPDHFDTTANAPSFQTACGSFTYLGQPFDYASAPVLTVTAKNAAGATTLNYTGNLFKLSAAGVTGQAYTAASGAVEAVAGSLPAPTVTSLGAGVGSVAFTVGDAGAGAGLRFVRGASPVAPFDADLALGFSLADSEGVTPASNPLAFAAATVGGGIAFDAGKPVRFGRLRLANATGTELRALPVPLTAQYWNGQGFVTNSADNCTTLPALAAVVQTAPLTPGLTFYAASADNQLAAGETTATLAAPLVSGNASLVLTAPGAGNHGYLDLVADAPAWLEYNWDGVDQGGDGQTLDDNPRARVAFGKRRGADRLIIRREIY